MAGLTYQEAKDRLSQMVAASEEPILDDDALEDLMRLARVVDRYGTAPDAYKIWKAATTYEVGDGAVPTSRGYAGPQSWSSQMYIPPAIPYTAAIVWQVTVAGVSGANEPVWPSSVVIGSTTVADGSVTWKAVNWTPWFGNWDTALAACEGWRRKAGLTANGYQFSDQGKMLSRNQIFEQCIKMSQQYGKKTMRSVSLSKGHVPYGRLIPGVVTNWDDDVSDAFPY
jgi:hypothetical protein